MDTFQTKVETWLKLDKTKQPGFYWQELWSEVLQRFLKRSAQFRKKFRTLISLVGMSPEPIILTIKALEPEEVFFLYSKETKKQLDIILEKTELKPSQITPMEIDSSRIEDVYAALKKITHGRDPKTMAVDITGGKKSMAAGAAQAAGFLNCSVFYVDYDSYHPEYRKPMPGTEFLNCLRNPYEIFGDIQMQRAMEHYRQGDYAAACEVVGRLAQQVSEPREAEIKKAIFTMMRHWEDYNFAQALKQLENAEKAIQRYMTLEELLPQLQEKKQVLEKIVSGATPWIILNHYFLANRFAHRGKYDFAVLLLYRTMELTFAHQLLTRYGLDPSNPDYSGYPDLLEQYNQKLPEAYGENARLSNRLPAKIAFMDAATLLTIFNDPLLAEVDLKNLRTLADHRNQGILAHGLKPNTPKQFDAMAKEFTKILKKYVETESEYAGMHLHELAERFAPVRFPEQQEE